MKPHTAICDCSTSCLHNKVHVNNLQLSHSNIWLMWFIRQSFSYVYSLQGTTTTGTCYSLDLVTYCKWADMMMKEHSNV